MANFETQLLLNLNELEFDTSKELTVEEIKSRYKKLSLHYHPDLNSNEIFRDKQKKINGAKEFLLTNLDEINRYIRRINHIETDEDKARAEKEQWQRDEEKRRAYYEQQARQKQEAEQKARADQEKARAEQKAKNAERAAEAAKAQAAAAEARAREAEAAMQAANDKRNGIKSVIIGVIALLLIIPFIIGCIIAGIKGFNEGMEKDRESAAIADKESKTYTITDTNLPTTFVKGVKINWSDYYVTYKDASGKDVKITLADGMVNINYETLEEQNIEITVNNGSVYLYHKATVLNATVISSVESLKAIVSNPTGIYILDSDIDLGGSEWTPLASFDGTLIGNGHSIKNLTITSFTTTNVGLFDTLSENAKISDLKLENVSIKSQSMAEALGALAGKFCGTINNITVSGEIDAPSSNSVGGIVGLSTRINTTITNCSFSGSVVGSNGVGGIMGGSDACFDAIISGSNVSGSVSGTSGVGGIAGKLSNASDGQKFEITNCKSSATVTAKIEHCGGIVGKLINTTSWGPPVTTITACINEGSVNGGDYTGGIVGYMHIAGGMGGSATIAENKNNANVNGKRYTGGIIGYNDFSTDITSGENNAAVTGEAYVGGIIGYGTYTTLTGLTNKESISGSYYVGGVAGYAEKCTDCHNSGAITATLYDTERSLTGIGGVVGLVDTAERCTNSGDITAKIGYGVGGVIGANATADREGKYSSCKNTGKITITDGISKGVGGIIGAFGQSGLRMNKFNLSGCESYGEIYASSGDSIGGIIGYLKTTDDITIISCTTTAKINAENCTSVGGIVGLIANPKSRSAARIETVTVKGAIIGKSSVGAILGKAAKVPENYETIRVTYTVENNENLPNIGALAD